jgi:fucose 4-O-acetylase-like acetyltransferase
MICQTDQIPIASRANFMNQIRPHRLYAIDSARGIGILLVVFGHAWRGAFSAGLFPDADIFTFVDTAIYAFHMPLFFLLGGVLFLETLMKYKTRKLFKGRVTRLLWPMALWSWVFFALKLGAGQAANTPVELADFPLVPLPPYEHLWFLWALFLCQALAILFYAVFGSRISTKPLRYGAGIVAVAMALLNPYTPVPSMIWGPMVEHLPYFLAGIALGGLRGGMVKPWHGVVFGVIFCALLANVGIEKPTVIMSLALVVLGWAAWMAVDRNLSTDNGPMKLLGYLGQTSMVIYLTHTVFSAALRILMLKVGFDNVWLVICATTLIGVIAPLVVLWCARRSGTTKLLGF